MMILQLSTVLLVSVLGVFAAPVFNPIRISSRDVWAPQIFEPSSDTTWVVGSTATATWYVKEPIPADVAENSHVTPPSFCHVPNTHIHRDTSNPPAQITNPQGTLVLGHLNSDGSGGENLDLGQLAGLDMLRIHSIDPYASIALDNPLAQGFDLHDGSVTFDVPDVEPNNNYIVARTYPAPPRRSS
jgi:hypothetical protein